MGNFAMSMKLYDNAFTEKIKKWTNDPNLTITSPDETRRVFQYRADIQNDKPIQLPLIAISRGKTIDVQNTSKKPTTFDSLTLEANDKKIITLQQIPIGLTYQIDIFTRYFEEADEYVRNFIFNIINYPKLQVIIPYNNINYPHTSNIRMINEVQDNSDIPERLIAGQFTRFTIGITVDDAYIWSVPIRDNLTLETELHVKLKDEK